MVFNFHVYCVNFHVYGGPVVYPRPRGMGQLEAPARYFYAICLRVKLQLASTDTTDCVVIKLVVLRRPEHNCREVLSLNLTPNFYNLKIPKQS